MTEKAKGWLLVITALAGVWLIRHGADDQLVPPGPTAAQAFAGGPTPQPGSPVAEPLKPSAPVRIRIPSIRVDAPMINLGLGADGSLDVPPAGNRNVVGWYRDGTPPGSKGSAIVAGHVDNAQGRAVFYDLGALQKGSTVEVVRRDGRTAVFSIDAIEVYENENFPDQRVYGASSFASLRLITCGGGFSEVTGYRGNVVAYAHLTTVR
ncbi:class F sortase [Streptomyces sp. JV185]|uniref:class F sortase n=1 Tax=Streptomyces sp. JV185 TaxID=858638 RepID=UPI002E7824EE|nr:class F sortase [Streptomyces sp. JV185]MEE1774347.1 class F sortase [Streptomyces sp. JV185]